MLLTCPYCGARDVSEFTYQGDGNRIRPNPMSQDLGAWNEYIYDRINIAGDQNEIWQHSGGCRAHLKVTRNTLTHKVACVAFARPESAPSRPANAKSAAANAAPATKPVAKRGKA